MPQNPPRRPNLARTLIAASVLTMWPVPFASAQVADSGEAPGVEQAQFPRGEHDPANAALLYYKLWLDPAFRELRDLCADQLRVGDPSWKPDAALTKLLNDHQGFIAMTLRATQAPECDFGIEWSQGIGVLLPHLGYLRGSTRILMCDAQRCVAEGRYDEAAERLAACYRMSSHVANDGLLISGLVSTAIGSATHKMVLSHMASTAVTVRGKELLLTELRRLTKPDAFGIKRGIVGERRWSSEWLRTFATGPKAGQLIARNVLPLAQPNSDPKNAAAMRRMTEAEVAADLDKNDRFYDDVLGAWSADDADARMKEIEAALERGEYGVIAKVLCPALDKARRSDTQIRSETAEVLAKLEAHIALSR